MSHRESSLISHPSKTIALTIGALGVVFGDIGTSPLYSIKECFHGIHAIAPTENNIFGVLSLIFWSLTMVVTVKYVTFIMRADNHGEGGIFALLGLIPEKAQNIPKKLSTFIVWAAIFGAALLYGDGIITPSITVLSAVEGIEIATTAAKPLIVPITCGILLALFLLQKRGTARIGKLFGPIMMMWFLSIAALGAKEIAQNVHVLTAIHPIHAVDFFIANRLHGFVVLGSVVLCITGGEALYADLGHFGRGVIRLSWLYVAFPALLLNYFGQGALLLRNPELAFNPFYGAVPRTFLYPMVCLATAASIIASQSIISGVFSLTQQAVQLGYCPRARIIHTSYETRGQIYIPAANYTLMVACIGTVIVFGESSRLAGAYGLAVTATMMLTSVIYFFVISHIWGWSPWKAVPLLILFLTFDISYFGANLMKIVDGGWFTPAVGLVIAIAMITWQDGRRELSRRIYSTRLPLKAFIEDVARQNPPRVCGTAVFMAVSPEGTPSALRHHLKHNHTLHEKVILLTIRSVGVPKIPVSVRISFEKMEQGFHRIIGFYGFMEKPNVPEIISLAADHGLITEPDSTTYYLSRETLIPTGDAKIIRWRKALFAFMMKNAGGVPAYFGIPPDRVIEVGMQVEL
jgi:KUP system potassium uptake protein